MANIIRNDNDMWQHATSAAKESRFRVEPGKGDKRRPYNIKTFRDRYDEIFRKNKNKDNKKIKENIEIESYIDNDKQPNFNKSKYPEQPIKKRKYFNYNRIIKRQESGPTQ
jgi:hypothetical protein